MTWNYQLHCPVTHYVMSLNIVSHTFFNITPVEYLGENKAMHLCNCVLVYLFYLQYTPDSDSDICYTATFVLLGFHSNKAARVKGEARSWHGVICLRMRS